MLYTEFDFQILDHMGLINILLVFQEWLNIEDPKRNIGVWKKGIVEYSLWKKEILWEEQGNLSILVY